MNPDGFLYLTSFILFVYFLKIEIGTMTDADPTAVQVLSDSVGSGVDFISQKSKYFLQTLYTKSLIKKCVKCCYIARLKWFSKTTLPHCKGLFINLEIGCLYDSAYPGFNEV
jgi:hypothetical protein